MEASVRSIVSLGQYVSTNNKQKCWDWGLQDSRVQRQKYSLFTTLRSESIPFPLSVQSSC